MARKASKRSRPAREETEESRPAGPRPFWSGTISFGLVSVPVNIYSAVRAGGIALRMLAPDGVPLQRKYFCPKEGRDVDYDELVRGYEVAPDEYVVLTDEELEAVAPRKTRDIDLRRFVDVDEIDPILFDRAYVLTPAGDTTKPYRLLAEVMERDHKAGIATAVMRDKEYLIAILAEGGILRAETLRFSAEVRKPSGVGLPKAVEAPRKLVSAFEKAIEAKHKAGVAKTELVDGREDQLRELIERKRKRGKDVIVAPKVEDEEEGEGEGDGAAEPQGDALFEVIRRSLAAAHDVRSAPAKPRSSSPKPRARAKARASAPTKRRRKAASA